MKKIFYENKFRVIDEIEDNHIHLDDGTVIRNNEIVQLPFNINISTYSEKKQYKEITNLAKSIISFYKKYMKGIKK